MSASPSAVVFNGLLYVFHQGEGNDGQLWYNSYDGQNFAGDTQVPNLGMSASPSAVVFNGLLYVFHQGEGNDGQLWYTSFDGEKWAGDRQVPNLGMSEGPSAVVDGQLYVFHQGGGKTASCGVPPPPTARTGPGTRR